VRPIGQVCYEALIAQFTSSKHPRTPWDKLPPLSRQRWQNAALAVQGLEVVAVVRPKTNA
jgi:hypothetical protein